MAEGMTAAERLEELRRAIAALDSELVDLLARRLRLATEIGEIKKQLGLPVLDPAREAEVVRRGAVLARERGVDPELVRDLLWRIIAQARGVQDAQPVRGGER
ncbi:MAG TPA: chorismate mutase [Longimicrobiales bacterium]